MLDRDALEKGILCSVVRDKNWEQLIHNGITREFFTATNKQMYDFIKGYTDNGEYPDLRLIEYNFNIDDIQMSEYTSIKDIDGMCKSLSDTYRHDRLLYELGELNNHQEEVNTDIDKYIQRIGTMYEDINSLGRTIKAVSIFDTMDNIMNIDPTDVISTGFKELDKIIVGERRGEDLITIVGRTGHGKSWMGLKFAMAGAIQGEKVGVYSGEMSAEQIQERIICCAKPHQNSTKEETFEYIKNQNLEDIHVLTQREIRGKANVGDLEQFIINYQLTLLIVDQLSLMEDNTCKPRYTFKTTIWKY